MRVLVAAAVLTMFGVAHAQESPVKGPATGDPSANSTTPKTYQGCVMRSNSKIMLTDSKNNDYILVSSGRALDSYVGQEVRLSAVDINPSDASSDEHGMSAEQPQGQPMTLDVENIQKVSEKCTSPQSTEKK